MDGVTWRHFVFDISANGIGFCTHFKRSATPTCKDRPTTKAHKKYIFKIIKILTAKKIFTTQIKLNPLSTYNINIIQCLQIVNKFYVGWKMMGGGGKPSGMHIKTKWCTIRMIGTIEVANHKIDKCINLYGPDGTKNKVTREKKETTNYILYFSDKWPHKHTQTTHKCCLQTKTRIHHRTWISSTVRPFQHWHHPRAIPTFLWAWSNHTILFGFGVQCVRP